MTAGRADPAPLAGKGAVVTGGGRGIGAAVARALVAGGAAVVVAARTRDQVEAMAAELRAGGGAAHAVVCDVSDPASVTSMASRAGELLGRVDILVNNSGVSCSAPFTRVTVEQWERMHRVNATGPLLATRAFLPGMLERGWGRIVNMASVAGLEGARYITAYAASKHALIGMTRCLAAELAGTGVTINSVCPSYVDTPMTDANIERIAARTGRSASTIRASLEEKQPGRRLIAAEEVADAVMTFLPEAAASLNGSELVIRGGTASVAWAGEPAR